MGAYTWTFIRIDKLNKEQIDSCINHVLLLNKNGGNTYARYSKMSEEEYVKDWLAFHKKNYDYFVNECDVPPRKMTDTYLTKNIKNRMKLWFYRQKCYQMVLDGTLKFADMLKRTHQLRGALNDFFLIKRGTHYYVHIDNEIFRNYEYCEKEFNTVESLIKHLENPNNKNICDFNDKLENSVQPEYGTLSEPLKNKIINYYNAIGDGNFIIQFG